MKQKPTVEMTNGKPPFPVIASYELARRKIRKEMDGGRKEAGV